MVDQSVMMNVPAGATKEAMAKTASTMNGVNNVAPPKLSPFQTMPTSPNVVTPVEAGSTEVRAAVVKQIEWYLGSENLERDYYLRQRMTPDFWAPLEVLLQFPKMQKLGVTEMGVVAQLLREASTEVLVDEHGLFVRPAWATPVPGVGSPLSAGSAGSQNHNSTLVLKDIPSSVAPEVVMQALKDIPKCPEPVAAQSEDNKDYHVTFETSDGAAKALEVATGTMIAGQFPITGFIRPDSQENEAQNQYSMMGIPPSPRSPYTPQVMMPPVPMPGPYGYGMPAPPYPGFTDSSRFPFQGNGVYPGGPAPMYGVNPPMSPVVPPVPSNETGSTLVSSGAMNGVSSPPQAMNGVNKGSLGSRPSSAHSRNSGRHNGHGHILHNAHVSSPGSKSPKYRNHNKGRRGGENMADANSKGYGYNREVPGPSTGTNHSLGGPADGGNQSPAKTNATRGLRYDRYPGGGYSANRVDGERRGGQFVNGNFDRRRGKGKKRHYQREERRNTDGAQNSMGPTRGGNRSGFRGPEISTMYFPPLPGSDETKSMNPTETTPRKPNIRTSVDVNDDASMKTSVSSDAEQSETTPAPVTESIEATSHNETEAEAEKTEPSTPKDASASGTPRRRDSTPGGMSYAAILQAKARSSISPISAGASSESIPNVDKPIEKNVSKDTSKDTSKDISKDVGVANMQATEQRQAPSPRSSTASLPDTSSTEVESKAEEPKVQNPSKSPKTELTIEEGPGETLSKPGSTIDSGISENDNQSVASSGADPSEMSTPVRQVSRGIEKTALSPSGSVWANKPKAVLEATKFASPTPKPVRGGRKINGGKTDKRDPPRAPATNGKQSPAFGKFRKGSVDGRQKELKVGVNKRVEEETSTATELKQHGMQKTPSATSSNSEVSKSDSKKSKTSVTAKGAWAMGSPKSFSRSDPQPVSDSPNSHAKTPAKTAPMALDSEERNER